jgi:hypothetical protein
MRVEKKMIFDDSKRAQAFKTLAYVRQRLRAFVGLELRPEMVDEMEQKLREIALLTAGD